ncbi:hypothetical protein AWC38_SpisGene3418 [Stylophora pistillata]|uniref:Integrase catalytic domain-containing protein n=1 Tax=Stylophora pistillata TaxID=50429 RepID=A0A2B4SM17_STYPI|nr:hypothetical protein AWC38_SpisGene3418 [Stylophora pistillata]
MFRTFFVTLSDSGPTPEEETQYAKAMRLLDAHFLPQVNIPFERHQFRQAKQEESETTDQFISQQETRTKPHHIINRSEMNSLPLETNGEVERQNRSFLKALKIAKAEKKNIWTEMRKFLTGYRTTPHTSTGVTPAKLLFNREIRSKIPELGNSRYSDSEARDKDAEMKQERTDYADGKRRARESELEPGDLVLLKQKKENKLSTSYGPLPYTISKKHGNKVIISSPKEVNMRRNVANVKKYLREDTTADEEVAEDDSSEPPQYLKDYKVYELCSVEEMPLDIMGPMPTTESGNKYILVVGDYFTKWKEAFAIQNQEAADVEVAVPEHPELPQEPDAAVNGQPVHTDRPKRCHKSRSLARNRVISREILKEKLDLLYNEKDSAVAKNIAKTRKRKAKYARKRRQQEEAHAKGSQNIDQSPSDLDKR